MIYRQSWMDVLFLHWAVTPELLHPWLAPGLELDHWQGQPWVSAVAFRLRVRPRGWPWIPGLCYLAELNLRTYVCGRCGPGIWFLNVHANNRVAAWMARQLTPIAYQYRPLAYHYYPNASLYCFETRQGCKFHACFTPRGPARPADDTGDDWWVERYRLYSPGRGGALWVAEVEHPAWPCQPVDLNLVACDIGQPFGLDLKRPPDAAQFSSGVSARFGEFRLLAGENSSS